MTLVLVQAGSNCCLGASKITAGAGAMFAIAGAGATYLNTGAGEARMATCAGTICSITGYGGRVAAQVAAGEAVAA